METAVALIVLVIVCVGFAALPRALSGNRAVATRGALILVAGIALNVVLAETPSLKGIKELVLIAMIVVGTKLLTSAYEDQFSKKGLWLLAVGLLGVGLYLKLSGIGHNDGAFGEALFAIVYLLCGSASVLIAHLISSDYHTTVHLSRGGTIPADILRNDPKVAILLKDGYTFFEHRMTDIESRVSDEKNTTTILIVNPNFKHIGAVAAMDRKTVDEQQKNCQRAIDSLRNLRQKILRDKKFDISTTTKLLGYNGVPTWHGVVGSTSSKIFAYAIGDGLRDSLAAIEITDVAGGSFVDFYRADANSFAGNVDNGSTEKGSVDLW